MSVEGLFCKTEKAIPTRWPFLILRRYFPNSFYYIWELFKNECISKAVYVKPKGYFLFIETITYQL